MPPTLVTFSSSLGYLSLNGYFSYETKSCKQIDPFSFNVMHLKFLKGYQTRLQNPTSSLTTNDAFSCLCETVHIIDFNADI